MKSENLHLYLGLTRNELKRRLELGLLDPQALKSQVEDYSSEIKLQALSEQWLDDHKSEDQVERDSIADNIPDLK
jgi:hypothetical protein